jgi:hypothetical protein
VRKLVEAEGKVVVTEQGTPRYRLTRYVPMAKKTVPAAKDYLAPLRRHQPRPLDAAEAAALHDAKRGDR